ncbi:hypothetical protein BH11MYX2_BH11MYX2_03690 [soil metagenome]
MRGSTGSWSAGDDISGGPLGPAGATYAAASTVVDGSVGSEIACDDRSGGPAPGIGGGELGRPARGIGGGALDRVTRPLGDAPAEDDDSVGNGIAGDDMSGGPPGAVTLADDDSVGNVISGDDISGGPPVGGDWLGVLARVGPLPIGGAWLGDGARVGPLPVCAPAIGSVDSVRGVPTGGGFVVEPLRGAPIGEFVGPDRAPDDTVGGIGALTAPVPIGAVFDADDGAPGIPVDEASLPSVDGRAATPNSDGAEPGVGGMYAAAAGCVSVDIADAATEGSGSAGGAGACG